MERPGLTVIERAKAELVRIGVFAGALVVAGTVAYGAVSVGGARASAEQVPAVHYPNDPAFSEAYTHQGSILANLPELLARPKPKSEVICGITDITGFSPNQDVKAERIIKTSYSANGSGDVTPRIGSDGKQDGHGSEVLTLMDGETDNGYGVATASSGKCKFVLVKGTDKTADEIRYLADSGVKVAVYSFASFTGPGDAQWNQDVLVAMDYAGKNGMIQFLGSGNDSANFDQPGQDQKDYIAAHAPPSVIVVGGLNPDGSSAPKANDGSRIDVKAIYYQVSVDAYGTLTNVIGGTSFASPTAASVGIYDVSCRLDQGQSLDSITPELVKHDIVSTEGPNKRLDDNGVATAAKCPEAPPPPTTSTNTTTTPEKKYTLNTRITTGANLGRLTINGKKMTSPIYQTTVKGQVETIRPVKKTPRAYVKSVTGCENTQMKKTISPLLACYVKLDGIHAGKPVAVENVRYAFASH